MGASKAQIEAKEENKMFKLKQWFWLSLSLLLIFILIGWVEQVQAQQKYPTKGIEIINGWAAGGSTDLSARLMAAYLSKKWGVPVNVVPKPGGITVPAQIEVYNAKPDGYTIFLDGSTSSSQLIAAVKNPPFNIMDRTFIGNIAISPLFYIVRSDSPIKSMKDVEVEAKKDPGNFTWSSLGGASGTDFAWRKFMRTIGVDVLKTKPVVSKGGAEGVAIAAAGTVKVGMGSITAAGPAIDGKLVRPLAVASRKRSVRYPDVPTIVEAGYPTAVHEDRYGPSGPPKIPSDIVEKWEKALEEMAKDPEFNSQLNRLGMTTYYLNARDTRELTLKEMEDVKELLGLK